MTAILTFLSAHWATITPMMGWFIHVYVPKFWNFWGSIKGYNGFKQYIKNGGNDPLPVDDKK